MRTIELLARTKSYSTAYRILKSCLHKPPNQLISSKYTLYNFFVLCGLEQFQTLSNVYFLTIVILAYVGEYSTFYETPISGIGTLLALSVVIVFSMTFEAVYDIKRHIEDNKLNSKMCLRLRKGDGLLEMIRWDQISPGDVIKITDRDQIPADTLIIDTANIEKKCYVETANIDGETNLKIKSAPNALGAYNLTPDEIANFSGFLVVDDPNSFLSFTGRLELERKDGTLPTESSSGNINVDTISLDYSNLLLRGSILRNTNWLIGIVVYTGNETKIAVSTSKKKENKKSRIDVIVNTIVFSIFLVEIALCFFSTLFQHFYYIPDTQLWYLRMTEDDTKPLGYSLVSSFITFFILYSGLIPISLIVILTFSRVFQALLIHWDEDMKESKCNSIELVQDIGQVTHIFSDKTGTLTKNEMELVSVAIPKRILGIATTDGENKNQNSEKLFSSSELEKDVNQVLSALNDKMQEKSRLNCLLLALSVCHTVIIERDGDKIKYNAEGPDEEALVIGAEKIGFVLSSTARSTYTVQIKHDSNKTCLNFKLVAVNEFTSERKMMSCLFETKDVKSGQIRYVLYAKGADNVMLNRLEVEEIQSNLTEIEHQLRLFSSNGLRTLVYCMKYLSEEEYLTWKIKYDIASKELGTSRKEALDICAKAIEDDFKYLGLTAIEDKLQDDVKLTVDCLRKAGINFWVLTGDKVETAMNIGYSTGFLDLDCDVIKLTSGDREANFKTLMKINDTFTHENIKNNSEVRKLGRSFLDKLSSAKRVTQNFFRKSKNSNKRSESEIEKKSFKVENNKPFKTDNLALIVSGDSLTGLLSEQNGSELSAMSLLRVAKMCSVVLACRVSPVQKALLVKLVRVGSEKRVVPRSSFLRSLYQTFTPSPEVTLAIGDGANDVAMILEAHIGVGIFGKEGQQAANAADFGLSQFKSLRMLLLKHGRYNYNRAATLILFIFYSQILFSLTFLAYGFQNKFSGGTVFFDYLVTFYTYPTNIGVALLAATNIDVSVETLLSYPALYFTGRLNRKLSFQKICESLILAVAHVCFICVCHFNLFSSPVLSRHALSSALYLNCIFFTIVKCCLETTNWTMVNLIGTAFCVGFFLVIEPIYYNSNQYISLIYGGSALWGDPSEVAYIWSITFFTTTFCFLSEILRIYLRKEFFPSIEDIVIESDRGYSAEDSRASFLTTIEDKIKGLTQPLSLPKQVVIELVSAIQNVDIKPARFFKTFTFDNPTDERAPKSSRIRRNSGSFHRNIQKFKSCFSKN